MDEHKSPDELPSFSHTAEWDPIKDTKKYPTNAYGEIDFLNNENDVLPLVSSKTKYYYSNFSADVCRSFINGKDAITVRYRT